MCHGYIVNIAIFAIISWIVCANTMPKKNKDTTSRKAGPAGKNQAVGRNQSDDRNQAAKKKQHVQGKPAASKSQPNPIRILVVGGMGTGKSSFVAAATGPSCNVEIGHGPDSCALSTHILSIHPAMLICNRYKWLQGISNQILSRPKSDRFDRYTWLQRPPNTKR